MPPQAYSIPAYLAHYYSHSTSSTPPTLPAISMVPPPTQYYSISPHPSAASYYTTLDPYAPTSLRVLPGQEGYYWVRPTGLHQPIYAPTPGIPTVPQPESNISQDFSYHQWGSMS